MGRYQCISMHTLLTAHSQSHALLNPNLQTSNPPSLSQKFRYTCIHVFLVLFFYGVRQTSQSIWVAVRRPHCPQKTHKNDQSSFSQADRSGA